ncbi:MAG: SRPBCC family protein [Candidatus Methylomirabilis sp.]|nr:SRPBCC family protein [Deltaproteobacteria bacterium]
MLKTRVTIDAPVEEVFDFFSKADNLGVITPPWMGFSIATPRPIAMGKGATIDYTIRLGPVPVAWRTEIERWEPGALFVDSQRKGPYRCWRHEHRFQAEGGRTTVEDRVYYAPPLGPLGRIANAAYVSSTLKRIFAYREKAIRLRFGTVRSTTGRSASR